MWCFVDKSERLIIDKYGIKLILQQTGMIDNE